MDVVEFLIIDHLAIRLLVKCSSLKVCVEEFASFHDFIVNCHAEIEDKIVFPTMKKFYQDKSMEYTKLIEWVGNDHQLIGTLGVNVIKYGEGGDIDSYKNRLDLYFKLLIEHNLREEKDIFPNWLLDIDEETRKRCSEEAKRVIEKYGIEKYTELTGLSADIYKII